MVHRCALAGLLVALAAGQLPPQLPAWYEVRNMTQPVDHFNAERNETFDQRYLLNATHWRGPPYPIVFYTGAEGTGVEAIFGHSGWVLALAEQLGALVVFAEMRFFGASLPFGDPGSFERSADRLGLLSIEQTIADYANLIATVRDEHGAAHSPVVSLGGSLAGSLSFFLRSKYPSAADMALASSAPILGYPGLTSPYGWYRVATATYETQAPGCPNMIRECFTDLMSASGPQLSTAFNTCTPVLDSTRFAQAMASRLTGSLAAAAESSYPPRFSPVIQHCQDIKRAGPGAKGLRPLVLPPGQCLQVPSVLASHQPGRPGREVGGRSDDSWDYLACTEIIHPIAANNQSDMFPPAGWSLAGLAGWCRQLFGVEPRPSWLPLSMGMAHPERLASSVSRVIFSNGLLDPWSAQSVTHNLSETLIAINIADGSHHSDLGAPSNPTVSVNDSASLVEARAKILSILKQWIAEAQQLRAPPPQAGLCEFPGSNGPAVLDSQFTCMPGSLESAGQRLTTQLTGSVPQHMYVDTKPTLYDMSPVSTFVDSETGRVKAAVIPRCTDLSAVKRMLELAKADGAVIALLTEEAFGAAKHDGPGEGLTGGNISAVAAAAKSVGIYVVCPFRIAAAPGESYNGAVIVGRNGTVLRARFSGLDSYQKLYPVLGWPLGPLTTDLPGGDKPAFSLQSGEIPVVPGQRGVQVWDLPEIGRVAVLICFDVNFFEVWHQAYALGARVVFWPSMMSSADRDAMSLARLFRYHIVANGKPGAVYDTTGRPVQDQKTVHSGDGDVVTGTMDLDSEWLHGNGPGTLICPGLTEMCREHPGVFELSVAGCGGAAATGCNSTTPGPEDPEDNQVFLVRSLRPDVMTVRQGFAKYGLVAYRDYIFKSRQGVNSLRQAKADIPSPDAQLKPQHSEERALELEIATLQRRLDALRESN